MTADPLTDADLTRLARMQVELLPRSHVSRLGVAAARAFWRFAANSPLEDVVVTRRDGEIVAAGLVSMSLPTLSRRLLSSPFALHALKRLPVAVAGLRRATTATTPCELVMLFTAAGWRGQGLGRGILTAVEARLRAAGVAEYVVRTAAHAGNVAIAFNRACGFTTHNTYEDSGGRFMLMAKRLDQPSA